MGEFEKEIPGGPGGSSIGTLGFDMELDGNREYVQKMFKPSKIDQVLNFYGIPYVHKNEYKKYLKYRIQKRHYGIVNDYFSVVLRSEGYDVSDFDFGIIQDEYNIKVPIAESTGLELKVNYDKFIENDKAHQAALLKQTDTKKDEQMEGMQAMMMGMMKEMKELKKLVGNNNVLSSKENTNDGQQPSGSDSATNAENGHQTTTPQENGSDEEDPVTGNSIEQGGDGEVQQSSGGVEGVELIGSENEITDSGDEGGEGCHNKTGNSTEAMIGGCRDQESDGLGSVAEPFKIGGEERGESVTKPKDRRTA